MSGESKGLLRQGAWMVAATTSGGVAMMLVNTLVSKRCGGAAYAEFKTLLSTFYGVAAVGGGLWMSFAQRTASAVTPEQLGAVAASARRTLAWTAAVWMGIAIMLAAAQDGLVAEWKLSGPGALWATWLLGLLTLVLSVLRGVVQGSQRFGVLGVVAMLDGAGRLATVATVVQWWQATATGAMLGAVAGCGVATAMAAWGAWRVMVLRGVDAPSGQGWTGPALLSIQAFGLQVLQQYDNIFWASAMPADALKAWNLGQTFSPAQTVGYGISQVTVPLVLVMLPRVARANAMGVGSSLLRVTLTCTGTIAGVAALASTVMPRLPLQVMFFNNPGNWVAAPLVPWFAWAMVPLMVSNVLLNDMVGRGVSRVAWIVAGCAVGYVATLHVLRPSLVAMPPMEAYRTGVTVLLAATSIMLAACLIARWRWFPSPAGPIAR